MNRRTDFQSYNLSHADQAYYHYFGMTNYIVTTPTNVIYIFYASSLAATSVDLVWIKSTDYGMTWTAEAVIKAGTVYGIAVWADWWSGITATSYIHIAYCEIEVDDVFYRYLDTSNDSLGTERTVFSGASAATYGAMSITRARGGKIMIAACIDAGVEYDTVKSNDYFATQSSIAEVFEAATQDQIILMPNPDSADNQDIFCIFWDASADEISLKKYDDSGDSWAESSIGTSMVDVAVYYATAYPQFAAAMDLTNNQVILVAWSAADTANADLRCWKIIDASITEVTNVVLNSTDDQACCGISIYGATWIASYCGKSDGSETWNTQVGLYYKTSVDSGTTWSAESTFGEICTIRGQYFLVNPIIYNNFLAIKSSPTSINLSMPLQKANFQLGM